MTVCKLFFVHGIDNESRHKDSICSEWFYTLKSAWARDSLFVDSIQIDVAAAFYGDKLAELSRRWLLNDLSIVDQGPAQDSQVGLTTLYQEYQEVLQESGRELTAEPEFDNDIVITEMGFPHHRSVKLIARTIELLSPENGSFLAKRFLPQAAAYLKRPAYIDSIVEEQILAHLGNATKNIVVSHSLGTVVMYRLLRKLASKLSVSLLVTLGSPLASVAVQKILPPPRIKPDGVGTWINAADKRDFVALHPDLTSANFGSAEVRNLPGISNRNDDRHSITGYLSDGAISEAIQKAIVS